MKVILPLWLDMVYKNMKGKIPSFLLSFFHQIEGWGNPNKSTDMVFILYIYKECVMTCSSHAVLVILTPDEAIWIWWNVFFLSLSFFPTQNSQDIQWTLAKASDPEPQLPEGSERGLHQQEPGQPGPCRAADFPQVPLPQRELHESHEHHQPGGWCAPGAAWRADIVLDTACSRRNLILL